jgi:hypothetical protein
MFNGLKSVPNAEVELVNVKTFRPMNSKILKYFVNELTAYTIVCRLENNVVALPVQNVCTFIFT